jgi:hypothetical protein
VIHRVTLTYIDKSSSPVQRECDTLFAEVPNLVNEVMANGGHSLVVDDGNIIIYQRGLYTEDYCLVMEFINPRVAAAVRQGNMPGYVHNMGQAFAGGAA